MLTGVSTMLTAASNGHQRRRVPLLTLSGDKGPEQSGDHEVRVVDHDAADVGLVKQRAVHLAGSTGDNRRGGAAEARGEQCSVDRAHAREPDEQPRPGNQSCQRGPEGKRAERGEDGRRDVPAQAAG